MSEIRKRIDDRKLALSEFFEMVVSHDRFCADKIKEIENRIMSLIGGDEESVRLNLQSEKDLEKVKVVIESLESIEKAIEEADEFVACSNLPVDNKHKDELAIAAIKVKRYKEIAAGRLHYLGSLATNRIRIRNALERAREFMEVKKRQLETSSQLNLERQLSEVNKCCLEIENEERELFSPIRRAREAITDLDSGDEESLEDELLETTGLWDAFEDKTKEMQRKLAAGYQEKRNLHDELMSLKKMLKNVQLGIRNFKVGDFVSLIEGEEEISHLIDGFQKRQEKIRKVLDRANEFVAAGVEGNASETPQIQEEARSLNNQIRFEFQEKEHAVEQLKRRFSTVNKVSEEKCVFMNALCDRLRDVEITEFTLCNVVKDLDKIDSTVGEVDKEVKALCENLSSLKTELPEVESEKCSALKMELEEGLHALQSLATDTHDRYTDIEQKAVAEVTKMTSICQQLKELQKKLSKDKRGIDLDMMNRTLSDHERTFASIIEQTESLPKLDDSISLDGCIDNQDDVSRMLQEVSKMKELVSSGISNKRQELRNANERKVRFENELGKALSGLEEIEDSTLSPVGEIKLQSRLDDFGNMLNKLDDSDSRLANEMENGGLFSLLPVTNVEESKGRMAMFQERSQACRQEIESQMKFITEKLKTKHSTELELRRCADAIDEFEQLDLAEQNETELNLLSEKLEKVTNNICCLGSLLEAAERERLESQLVAAKNRVSKLVACLHDDLNKTSEKEESKCMEQRDAASYVSVEGEIKPNAIAFVESYVNVKDGDSNSEPDIIDLKDDDKAKACVLRDYRKRVESHAMKVEKVRALYDGPSSNIGLEDSISNVSESIESISLVLEDIPRLYMELDEFGSIVYVDQVSALGESVRSLEQACNATMGSLIDKRDDVSELLARINKYQSEMEEFGEKLQQITDIAKHCISADGDISFSQQSIDEAREIIGKAESILRGTERNLLEKAPLDVSDMLRRKETIFSEKIGFAKLSVEQLEAGIEMHTKLLEFGNMQIMIDKYRRDLGDIKEHGKTAEKVKKIQNMINTVSHYVEKAETLKGCCENVLLLCKEDGLKDTVKSVFKTLIESSENLKAEAETTRKSIELFLDLAEKVKDLNAFVENADQRSDSFLMESDIGKVIKLIGDSIQEISNVSESLPRIYKDLADVSSDLRPEQIGALKDSVDAAAATCLKIRQKLAAKAEKVEKIETAREHLRSEIEDVQEELGSFDGKLNDSMKVEDLNDIHDFLNVQEMKLREMQENIDRATESLVECLEGSGGSDDVSMAEREAESLRGDVAERASEVVRLKNFVNQAIDIVNKVEGRFPVVPEQDLENPKSVIEQNETDLKDEIENKTVLLRKALNELSERFDEYENMDEIPEYLNMEKMSTESCGSLRSPFKIISEKCRNQVLKAKEKQKKILQLQEKRLVLLEVSENVFEDEKTLEKVVLSCSETDLHKNLSSRAQEIDRQKQIIGEMKKRSADSVQRLDALSNSNPEMHVLRKRCLAVDCKCNEIEKNVHEESKRALSLKEMFEERLESLDFIVSEIEAAKMAECIVDPLSGENLKTNLLKCKERLTGVENIKSKLHQVTTQCQEMCKQLPEEERDEIVKRLKEASGSACQLECNARKEVSEAETFEKAFELIEELGILEKRMANACKDLRENRVQIKPEILQSFEKTLLEKSAEIGNVLETVTYNCYSGCNDVITRLAKEKVRVHDVMEEVKELNNQIKEGDKKLKELKESVCSLTEVEVDLPLTELDLNKRFRELKRVTEEKKNRKSKTEVFRNELEEMREKVPVEVYADLNKELLEIEQDCKGEIDSYLAKVELCQADISCLESFREQIDSLRSKLQDFESKLPVRYSQKQLKDILNGIIEDENSMAKFDEQLEEIFISNIVDILDHLSEREKNEVLKVKDGLKNDINDVRTKIVLYAKEQFASRAEFFKELEELQNYVQEIFAEVESFIFSGNQDKIISITEEFKSKENGLRESLKRIREQRRNDQSLNPEEKSDTLQSIGSSEGKIDGVLEKSRAISNCIKVVKEIRDFGDEPYSLAEAKDLLELSFEEKEAVLQDTSEKICIQKSVYVELKAKFENCRKLIDESIAKELDKKLSSEITVLKSKEDLILSQLSQNQETKKFSEDCHHSLKKVLENTEGVNFPEMGREVLPDDLEKACETRVLLKDLEDDLEAIYKNTVFLKGNLNTKEQEELNASFNIVRKRIKELDSENERCLSIFNVKIKIKDTMVEIADEVEAVGSIIESFDSKSENAAEALLAAKERIEEAFKRLKELSANMEKKGYDGEFFGNTFKDLDLLEERINNVQCSAEEQISKCNQYKDVFDSIEERLKVMDDKFADLCEIGQESGSLDEILSEKKSNIESIKRLHDNVIDLQTELKSVEDNISDSAVLKVRSSIEALKTSLEGKWRSLNKEANEIIENQKKAEIERQLYDVRANLQSIKQPETNGLDEGQLECGLNALLENIDKIEGLENELKSMIEKEASNVESQVITSMVSEIANDLSEAKRENTTKTRALERKMEIIAAIEDGKGRLARLENGLQGVEFCDWDNTDDLQAYKQNIAQEMEGVYELHSRIDEFPDADNDAQSLKQNLERISTHLFTLENALNLIEQGKSLHKNLQKSLEEIPTFSQFDEKLQEATDPTNDLSIADLVNEGKRKTVIVNTNLRVCNQLESAIKQIQELPLNIELLNTVKSLKEIEEKFGDERELLLAQLDRYEDAQEIAMKAKHSIEAIQSGLVGFAVHVPNLYEVEEIPSILKDFEQKRLGLIGMKKGLQEAKEMLSKSLLADLLAKTFASGIEELENKVATTEQDLDHSSYLVSERQNISKSLQHLATRVSELSDEALDRSFWTSCIKDEEKAQQKMEELASLLSCYGDLEKRLETFSGDGETHLIADGMKELKSIKEKLLSLESDVQEKHSQLAGIRETCRRIGNAAMANINKMAEVRGLCFSF